MQHIKRSILKHVCIGSSLAGDGMLLFTPARLMCASPNLNSDNVMARVIGLVKKCNRIDANKVTENADFQKDLCLDSLDRVELVMAVEEEFSIEIPEEKADKLACCADVVKYVLSEARPESTQDP